MALRLQRRISSAPGPHLNLSGNGEVASRLDEKAVMKFLSIFLIGGCCLASDSVRVVTTKYGTFEFSSVSLKDNIFGNRSCVLSGKIENKTDGSWLNSQFSVTLSGSNPGESVTLDLTIGILPIGGAMPFSVYCYANGKGVDYPAFEPDKYTIKFEGGCWNRGALPVIQSGSDVAFIASDKKCSAQFLEALAMDALEKWKRMADLVSFGCGFIA